VYISEIDSSKKYLMLKAKPYQIQNIMSPEEYINKYPEFMNDLENTSEE